MITQDILCIGGEASTDIEREHLLLPTRTTLPHLVAQTASQCLLNLPDVSSRSDHYRLDDRLDRFDRLPVARV